ncbi:MAG: GC-type dockerin domain-anchored protein [Phycisphaerales bacterium]|jgi:hypothetical protein|nr:GC-type dockerin domain-anchored protein [Phycisphaerales bacterium]
MSTRAIAGLIVAAFASAAIAQDHHHMTVDTFTSLDGPKIKIVVGFLGGEESFSLDENGTLLFDGTPHTYELTSVFSSGSLAGWGAVQGLTLTSDYYFATGRLVGGNFHFEITNAERLNGSTSAFALGYFPSATPFVDARSDGADRAARSYTVGNGGHQHGQFMALQNPGVYRITLAAWDSNGVYLDSDPVNFLVEVPGWTCAGDWDESGELNSSDFLAYLNDYSAQNPAADLAPPGGDGVFNSSDFLAFLNLYAAGC